MNVDYSVPATVVFFDENRLANAENADGGGVAAQEVESVDEIAARQVNEANAYEVARPEMAATGVTLVETYAPHAVIDCGCSYSDCTEKTRVRFLSCFRLQCTSSCSQCDANDLDPFPQPRVVSCPNTRC